jgi:hypothetical protein
VDLIREFTSKMQEHNLDFSVLGFYTSTGRIYPLGTDTKVLSTFFELVCRPLIFEIAQENNLQVVEPYQQNYYPDFTLMTDEKDEAKVAIDVKTTYRNFTANGEWTASFTLGSYTSFMRNETKNIRYPYNQYSKHYVIGFIYTREEVDISHGADRYTLENIDEITSHISDVDFFIQEKYRISGDHAGSGNTTNIGSISGSSIDDFVQGRGPFSQLGEDVFNDYWRNYGRTKRERTYNNVMEYLDKKASRAHR